MDPKDCTHPGRKTKRTEVTVNKTRITYSTAICTECDKTLQRVEVGRENVK